MFYFENGEGGNWWLGIYMGGTVGFGLFRDGENKWEVCDGFG